MKAQSTIETLKYNFALPRTMHNAIEQSLAMFRAINKAADAVVYLNDSRRVYIEHEKNQYKLARFMRRHAGVELDSVAAHYLNEKVKTAFYIANPSARYRLEFSRDITRHYVETFGDGMSAFPLGSCMTMDADAYESRRHPVSIYETEKHGRVWLAILWDTDPEPGTREAAYINENPDAIGCPVARALVNSETGACHRVYFDDDGPMLRRFYAALAAAGFDDSATNSALDGLSFKHVTNHDRLVFPYLDGDGFVRIDYSGRVVIDSCGDIECCETNGIQEGGISCDCCGETVDRDTLSTVADGSAVCEYCLDNEYTYIEAYCEYYPNDETVYSDYINESLLSEDATYCDGIEDYMPSDSVQSVAVRVDGETINEMEFPDDYDTADAARIVADNA